MHRPAGSYDDVAELTRRRQAMQARRASPGRGLAPTVALVAVYAALVALIVALAALAGAL